MGGESSRPVKGIPDYAARGKGFFMMCRNRVSGSVIYVYGLPIENPILHTIFDAIKNMDDGSKMSAKPDKHGEFVTKFKLGGFHDYFGRHNSFETAGRIKIMFNEMIESVISKHGYRPAFSTDLSRYNDRCTIYWENIRDEKVDPEPVDVACLTLSSSDKIQLTCRKPFLTELKSCLLAISKEHVEKGWTEKDRDEFGENWIIAELDLNYDCWHHSSSAKAKMTGRLLVARLLFHFGRTSGWNFLFNGNIKDTADYIWFVRSRNGSSLIPNDFAPIAGFDLPLRADASVIMLCSNDKLRVVNFPAHINQLVEKTIQDFGWEIQKTSPEKHHPKSHEIKLKGNPWWTHGKSAVRSRMLIMELITKLLSVGYVVRTALDVSRKINDKANIVFSPCSPIHNSKTLILSPTDVDHLRMIGDVGPSEEKLFHKAVTEIWPGNVKKYEEQDQEITVKKGQKVLFADMHGSPWRSWNGNEMLHSRNMVMFLLNGLRELGWIILCSADVSAKCHRDDKGNHDYSLDCHSIFMIKHDSVSTPLVNPAASFELPDSPPSYFTIFGIN